MAYQTIDLESSNLCLIDSGVTHISDIPLSPNLVSLNLHCNNIERINHLNHCINLKHLDLSSNKIARIEGVSQLINLRTLNLACNLVTCIEGLENLRNLSRLNLSYNNIDDIRGFHLLYGPQYKLQHVELHGNNIHSVELVTRSLQGCTSLRHLTLQHDSATNPVCHQQDYESRIWRGLPQLQSLDSKDRHGNEVVSDSVLSEIPGLEDYLDFLTPGQQTDAGDIVKMSTPNIDQALEKFRQQGCTTPEQSSTPVDTTVTSMELENSPPLKLSKDGGEGKRLSMDHELRLEKLEHQLTHLLYAPKPADETKMSSSEKKIQETRSYQFRPKRDTDATDESDIEKSSTKKAKASCVKQSRIPSLQNKPCRLGDRKKTKRTSSSSATTPRSPTRDVATLVHKMEEPTAQMVDEQQRIDIESTYVELMKELEEERERRWKAEQAAKKLVEHIKELHIKAKEESDTQDVAIQATARLKQALTNERESRLRSQDDLKSAKKQLEETSERLKRSLANEDDQRRALRSMESASAEMETRRIQELAEQSKKAQQAQLQSSANQRETELLRNNVKMLKGQLQQMQELLATREQEHREELSKRHKVDSPELQNVIERQVAAVDARHLQQLQLQQERVQQVTRQYQELEEEFRMALQIESNRFTELQAAFKSSSEEAAQNKQALVAAQTKDEKTTIMVAELTALVKEQKARISELSKNKQEQIADLKSRLSQQDAHLEEARKRLSQMEFLKQENKKLVSEMQAQVSVIEGLRAERKLWGHELAQQGASLAQDRGRLEAKIEYRSQEVVTLNKQLDREADAKKKKVPTATLR